MHVRRYSMGLLSLSLSLFGLGASAHAEGLPQVHVTVSISDPVAAPSPLPPSLGTIAPPAVAPSLSPAVPGRTWAVSFGGAGGDRVTSIVVARDGAVFVAGVLEGTASLDGAGREVHTVGGYGSFLSRFSPAGVFEWTRVWDAGDQAAITALALAPDGDVVAAGRFRGGLDLDPGDGTDLRAASGGTLGFVLRVSPDGAYRWGRTFPAVGQSEVDAVAVGADGTIAAGGNYHGAPLFSTRTTANSATPDPWSAFVVTLDPTGAVRWSRSYSSAFASCVSLAVGVDGAVYWGGLADERFGLGIPGTDFVGDRTFVASLDARGEPRWLRSLASPHAVPIALALGAGDDVLLSGYYVDRADFDPGPGRDVRPSADHAPDAFLWALDRGGRYRWARTVSAISDDVGAGVRVAGDGTIVWVRRAQQSPAPLAGAIFVDRLSPDGAPLATRAIATRAGPDGMDLTPDGALIVGGGFLRSLRLDAATLVARPSADGTGAPEDAFVTRVDLGAAN